MMPREQQNQSNQPNQSKHSKRSEHSKRLIGLDPGLRFLGWGVIEVEGNRLVHIANDCVSAPTHLPLAQRLVLLEKGLENVFDEFVPMMACVEDSFVNKDGAATLKLGHARAICLLVAARRGLKVFSYAPNFVKKSVVGVGHANKEQVKGMVERLLPNAHCENEHSADALAIAITHAHAGDLDGKIAAAIKSADKNQKRRQKPKTQSKSAQSKSSEN